MTRSKVTYVDEKYLTYEITTAPALEADRIEADMERFIQGCGADPSGRPVVIPSGGLEANELLDRLKEISPDVRAFVMPRDHAKDWDCYPSSYRPALTQVVDRSDPAGTDLKVREVFNP